MRTNLLLSTAAAFGMTAMASAQVWNETTNGGGDAGALPGGAQSVNGSGPLLSITGAIAPNLQDIDMYLICIDNAAAFTAAVTTYAPGDSQLFLFNTAGVGIAFDDDGGPGLQALLSNVAGTGAGADANLILNAGNGLYYLVMADFDTDALNSTGGQIWHDGSPFDGPFAPDGPGSADPVLASWASGNGTANVTNGAYTITLTGACFVPGPGALALLGLACVTTRRRRR